MYSGVTVGLYHGSAPHLLVLCHEAGRAEIEGAGGGPHVIPPLRELVELHERLALPIRPVRVVAVAVNTAHSTTKPRAGRSPPPRPKRASRPTIPFGSALDGSWTQCCV